MKPPKRKTITIDGVMDIETEHWDTFVCGGLWTPRDGFKVWKWTEQEKYVDALLATKGSVWAHNGGRYDALWFLQHVLDRGLRAKVRCSGQRLITVEVGDLKLRDSAALVPMSLDKASQMGSHRKSRTELPCTCGLTCGGYCSFRRSMSSAEYRKLVSYLEQDCLATASFLQFIIGYAEEKNLDLTSTVGSSAYSTVKRTCGIADAKWDTGGRSAFGVYKQARLGYYGGRTQVFSPRAESGFRYDINSAYPAALANLSLPVGPFADLTGRAAQKAYRDGKPGIYRASVRIPLMFCPPLPVRCVNRIAYPTGSITGSWTEHELAHAEACGVVLESISEGLSWDAREMVFADFCRYIWSLRDEAGPKTALGTWLKWFANSLTGKLAQRTEIESVCINPADDTTFCPADYQCDGVHPAEGCCIHRCNKSCGAYRELARGIFTRVSFRISECAHIHHAAYLTASTRVSLHQQLVADTSGGRTAVYCDTDSCIATVKRVRNLGDGLGEWKEEGAFSDFEAIAPKTYTYLDERGKRVAKSKGIPDAVRNFYRIRDRVPIDRGVDSFRSAARGGKGLFHRKQTSRRVHGDGLWYGDRILKEDGLTWPMDASEMRD